MQLRRSDLARLAGLGIVNAHDDIHEHIHRQKPAFLLGLVNVVNVVNVLPGLGSHTHARTHTRKD